MMPDDVRKLLDVVPFEELVEARFQALFDRFDPDDAGPAALPTVLEAVEAVALRVALERTAGNQVQAARLLGIHRNTLRKRVAGR